MFFPTVALRIVSRGLKTHLGTRIYHSVDDSRRTRTSFWAQAAVPADIRRAIRPHHIHANNKPLTMVSAVVTAITSVSKLRLRKDKSCE